DLSRQAIYEGAAGAKAQGISLKNEDLEKGLKLPPHGGDFKTSMLQDLEAGKALELEELNGVVINKGRALGIPTPYNFTLYALLKGHQA
ncbi:MAG: 2-dehydropantoate 2-reductase, partial [candidate division NC10 bacterium]|nr:2-dehydropantoate 2-reductase [candidate division NC10 bacterium]